MKAVIFDLDGTLWDSTGQVYQIWNSVFARYPGIAVRVTRESVSGLAGKTMEDIGAALFPDMEKKRQRTIMDECGEAEVVYLRDHGGVLYSGARETVDALKPKYGLYIVSNCQSGYVEAFLHAHGFAGDFRDIEMSGRTGKPKGENIRILMERNGLREAVYVGDTEGDEAAARFAGIPFIHAAYGFGKAVSPDAIAHEIRELPRVVRRILP